MSNTPNTPITPSGKVRPNIMTEVAAGSETGTYYIPLGNLPYMATWYELRDWFKQVCHVHAAQVIQGTGSGWVRVDGLHNFEAALDLVSRSTFQGLRIVATDMNRKNATRIRVYLPEPVPQ